MIVVAWWLVKQFIVVKCWQKVGIIFMELIDFNIEVVVIELDIVIEKLWYLVVIVICVLNEINFQDFVIVDDDFIIFQELMDIEVIQGMVVSENIDEVGSEDEGEVFLLQQLKIIIIEVILSVQKFRRFFFICVGVFDVIFGQLNGIDEYLMRRVIQIFVDFKIIDFL